MTAEVAPPPRERVTSAARLRDPVATLRSSLLLKILAALVVALVGSSALTAFLESRLTQSALREQARRVTLSNLRVLTKTFRDGEANLISSLRNLGQSLTHDGLVDPSRRTDLIGELGGVRRNLGLDTLDVVGADGSELATSGEMLKHVPAVTQEDRRTPAGRLLQATDGHWLQAVMIRVGPGPDAPVLLGAYEFGDGFAFRLRGQLGDVGEVILIAGDKVVGATFADAPSRPPAATGATGRLPTTPVVVPLEGVDNLVVYSAVGGSHLGVPAAVGVSLADPEAPLHRALTRTRLLAAGVLAAIALAVGWLCFRALVRPLVRLTSTAGRIAAGDLEASFAAGGNDEVAILAQSLERMRLEVRGQLDVIARQAAGLQDSSSRIVAAQDEERHRLARDLHDGIQQHLVVLRMGFGLAKEAAERSTAGIHASLEELSAELDAVIERLREVSHDLYPSILVDRGLAAALRSSLGRLPLSARLVCDPDPLPRLPAEIESGAYFLVGEALANALKHAAASEIDLRLAVSGRWLVVEVRDDGRGFDPLTQARSGGLLHMDDRTRSFGGELTIVSAPGAGTCVRATFPVRAAVEMAGPSA